jgi:photosystem II stability/assembly factor-like uncharacterized protein
MLLDASTGWLVECKPPTDHPSACDSWVDNQPTDSPATYSLLQTLDGGVSWTTLATLPDELTLFDATGAPRISFIDANAGWAVTSSGGLMSTTDGGANWIPLTPVLVPSTAN